VCLKPHVVKNFIGRFGGDREKLRTWADRVCEREAARLRETDKPPTFGDDFDYWTAAYDAEFAQTKVVATVTRVVPDADETDTVLAGLRADRG